MRVDTSSPEKFQESWVKQRRPLLIVDECRQKRNLGGEYVLFAFLLTDTYSAVEWANEAHELKKNMTQKTLPKKFKGSDLFGKNQQSFHEPYRAFVKAKIRSSLLSFLLIDSTLLPAIVAKTPSRIKLIDQSGESTGQVEGRELSPFLNCLKTIISDRKINDPIVDVLVDRSFQLGLDPASRKIGYEQFQLFGPGPLTDKLPTEFLFISTAEEGAFSDLLVMPDSLAYLLMYNADQDYMTARKKQIEESRNLYYWHDIPGNLPKI